MKAFAWIEKNKYPLVVVALFIAIALIVLFFIQSLKKDHSLEVFKMKMELKEEARMQLERERSVWQQIVNEKTVNIEILRAKDSVVQLYISDLNNSLNNLPKKYNEKAKAINNYSDADLQQYFNQLPPQPDNDYSQ